MKGSHGLFSTLLSPSPSLPPSFPPSQSLILTHGSSTPDVATDPASPPHAVIEALLSVRIFRLAIAKEEEKRDSTALATYQPVRWRFSTILPNTVVNFDIESGSRSINILMLIFDFALLRLHRLTWAVTGHAALHQEPHRPAQPMPSLETTPVYEPGLLGILSLPPTLVYSPSCCWMGYSWAATINEKDKSNKKRKIKRCEEKGGFN